MKTTSILLAILILFQSCYTYKKIPKNSFQVNFFKEHKITLSRKKSLRGKIIKINADTLVLSSKGINYAIPKATIKKITELTYSNRKTKQLVGAIVAVILVFLGLNALNNLNFGSLGGNGNWLLPI